MVLWQSYYYKLIPDTPLSLPQTKPHHNRSKTSKFHPFFIIQKCNFFLCPSAECKEFKMLLINVIRLYSSKYSDFCLCQKEKLHCKKNILVSQTLIGLLPSWMGQNITKNCLFFLKCLGESTLMKSFKVWKENIELLHLFCASNSSYLVQMLQTYLRNVYYLTSLIIVSLIYRPNKRYSKSNLVNNEPAWLRSMKCSFLQIDSS